MRQPKYTKQFSKIRATEISTAGGKLASLGEMKSQLVVPVPDGFAIVTAGFDAFVSENNLALEIIKLYREFSPEKNNLAFVGLSIRNLIEAGEFPQELKVAIIDALTVLSGGKAIDDMDVGVRSSAPVEDNPKDSFAGQFESFMNVRGVYAVLRYIKKCFASLFTDRAISYRHEKGYDPLNISIAVGVQKMVRSDKGAAGVMFTLDPVSGFRNVTFIQSSYGLGEMVVQGAVNPDSFYVFKPTGALIRKVLGSKKEKMIYAHGRSGLTQVVKTTQEERDCFSLSDEEVLELARYAAIIEAYYGRPMDIEWAKDGIDGKLYIVQARPETVKSREAKARMMEQYVLSKNGEKILASGESSGEKVSVGIAQVILGAEDMDKFVSGNILVTDMTDPNWEPIMKKAIAMVTNRGGTTCHAAIIAREIGIPAVVGCADATKSIPNGQYVTVSCAEGEEGYVYEGKVTFVKEEVDVSSLHAPRQTKIMLNIADPGQALSLAAKFEDLTSGAGLVRLELVMNKFGVHPNAILEYGSLKPELREKIDLLTKGYKSPQDCFTSKIAESVATIAAASHPQPAIIRFSDFKTNEYRGMLGENGFEPIEENPTIGWRGAGRYFSPKFVDCFKMECEAICRARYEMGLDNIWVMIPFVRTPITGRRVVQLLAENGLRQSDGLKIICMCEINANVMDADELLDIFDGFSIGTNDLKQLFFGFDRDGGMREEGVDDRNPTLLRFMEIAIKACKRRGKYIGVCGQAPSNYKEVTEFFVKCGVESLSLNPDSVFKMLEVVARVEQELGL